MRDPTEGLIHANRRIALDSDVVLFALVVVAGALLEIYGSLYVKTVVIDGIVVMAVAYSWDLISGYLGYVSFGQVAFYGVGSYATAIYLLHSGLSWPLALLLGALTAGALAVPVGLVLLRLQGMFFALGTLAVMAAFELLANGWGYLGAGAGLTLSVGVSIDTVLEAAFVLGAIAVLSSVFLSRSRLGLRTMAIRDDEDAAQAMGVRTMRVKVAVFVLSGVVAGLAGAVGAWNTSFVTPTTGFSGVLNLQGIVYTLVGGMGSVWGPLFGTGVLDAITTQLGPRASIEVDIALGVLVVLFVVLSPKGIVGIVNRIGLLRRRVLLPPRRHRPSISPTEGWLRRLEAEPGSGSLLSVRDLTVRFGAVTAVDHVDLDLAHGEFVAIIGANGAGKTTLFNAVSGSNRKVGGSTLLLDKDVSRHNAARRAREGIIRTFQIPRLADTLTVWENVLLGSLLQSGLRAAQDRARLVIDELGLEPVRLETVDHLGPGTRRRVEIARVMAARPRIALLDEALAGMSSEEIQEVRGAVQQLRVWGAEAVISVEHVLSAVRDLADRMIAMDFGKVVADGLPDAVLSDEAVVGAYLGTRRLETAAPSDRGPAVAAAGGRPPEPVVRVEGLTAGYGQVRVLWDVRLELAPGELVAVLGASGAGKTTLCRAITGACAVHQGRVVIDGEDRVGTQPHLVARMGVAHVPSSRELFGDMTVNDNLRLGAVRWRGGETDARLDEVLGVFPEIRPLLGRKARMLSGGQQQMVAIGRALMRAPTVLVLDEPSTGLAPIVVGRLMEALRELAESGVAILVAEQNAVEALRVVRRAYVLQEGRIVFDGTAEELRDDPRLVRAYLGASTDGAVEPPAVGAEARPG